jgi:hypothetical protein
MPPDINGLSGGGFRVSSVNRSRIAIIVAVLAVVLVLGSAVVGHARERTTIFVPSQPIAGVPGATVPAGGATVTCDSGPPFVLFVDFVSGPTAGGTCTFEHFGRPGGNFVCDDPTTLFIRFVGAGIADIPLSAFVCSVPVEEPQPLPPAPITQESEQESESGEIEQTFDIS